MSAFLQDLGSWLWRLIPANPILVRVVSAGGRRLRHLWIRIGYLAILAVATVIGVLVIAQRGGAGASLDGFAKNATSVFEYISVIQLGMVCLLAPLFTAAAITQEKDAQTFAILLSTPLSNSQIVLGSLLSRMYFVFVLLIAGIPLFCIMMVYGGITGDKIILSSSLAAGTALFTGSLAIAISMIRVGTGRTIFSFYMAIAIYLIAVYTLSSWGGLIPPEADPAPGRIERMSWLAAFHPFLSLYVVMGQTPAPEFGAVAHYGFPGNYLLAYPHHSFIVMTVLGSVLLILLSLFFVRNSAKEGEPTLYNRLFGGRRKPEANDHDEANDQNSRKPKRVWKNPIAWMEASTKAAATGGPAVRYGMFIVGLAIGIALLVAYGNGTLTLEEARAWLFGLIAVELGITLFIATATAATSMTREKESSSIELLLATPLTSKSIIWGKIYGLVSLSIPMLLVPFITVVLFVLYDAISGNMSGAGANPVVFAEAVLTLPILLVSFTAFGCILGLQASIKNTRTLVAVLTSVGIVVGVFALTYGCAIPMKDNSAELAAAFMPFTPVPAMHLIVDPGRALANNVTPIIQGNELNVCRLIAFVAAICSAGVYGLIGVGMHRSMVRNFDMIIRKQSA